MSKNNQLLVRIDERTTNIQKDVSELKDNQKEVFEALKKHHGRLCSIEAEHKKPFHQGTIFGLFRLLFGNR